ncbi:hypothetical protein GCM10027063_02940 [Promicromonospora xylanilytica]
MAPDPEEDGALVFDLVDDDAGAGASSTQVPADAAEATGAGPGGLEDEAQAGGGPPAGAVPGDGLRARLRLLAPVAAVLAIVLGTGYALDGVRDAARIDRVRGVHGGVVDVSSPLTEQWAWDGGVGSGEIDGEGGFAQVAVLGGLLVFVSDDELLALDASSGARAWAVPLGEQPECGPAGYPGWETTVTSTVVCVQGADADREVVAVGPEGRPSPPRALDAEDLDRYGAARPGPGGTVLRARRVGSQSRPELAGAACAPAGECTGTVDTGRSIGVRAEDAVTGAELWTVSVPFVPTPAGECAVPPNRRWAPAGDPTTSTGRAVDTEAFGAQITSVRVDLYGCGVNASVTRDGVLLRGVSEPGDGQVASLTGGGHIASSYSSETSGILYSAAGDVLATVPGRPFEASVVDGAGTLVGAVGNGSRLRAYEPDGTPLWAGSYESRFVWFAAEAGETAVLVDGGGTVHGLDVVTGDERWDWIPAERVDATPLSNVFRYRAFTDGRQVLLYLLDEEVGARLVSLDAVSGDLVWTEAMVDVLDGWPDASLVSVDGHLLAVTPGGVRGLG